MSRFRPHDARATAPLATTSRPLSAVIRALLLSGAIATLALPSGTAAQVAPGSATTPGIEPGASPPAGQTVVQSDGPAQADAQGADRRHYRIAAGPLADVLARLLADSGLLLAGSTDLARGRRSPGVDGTMTARQALDVILRDSGLRAVPRSDGSLMLRPAVADASGHGAPAAVAAADEATLAPVTVLGSRDPNVPLSNVPASISIVTPEALADQRATSERIDEMLGATVPGMNPTNGGVRRIRGRVAQVFVNGVPTNEQLRAAAGSDLNLLAPDQLESVEVARGANAAYGFGSPGGVIALSTPRASTDTLQLRTRLGTSFNTGRTGGTLQSSLYQSASQIRGDFDFHVGLSLRKDGLARDPDGRPALDFGSPAMFSMGKETLYGVDTHLGYRVGRSGTLRLIATAGRADVDEAWISNGGGTYRAVDSALARDPAGDRNTRRHHTMNIGYENTDLAGSSLKVEVLKGRVHSLQYATVGAILRRDDQTNIYSGVRSSLTTPLDGLVAGASISYGLDYLRNRYFRPQVNDATGAVLSYISPDVTLDTWAPFVQAQVPYRDWRFSAGVRYERYGGQVETAPGRLAGGDIRSFDLALFNAGVVRRLGQGREFYGSFSQGAEVSQLGRSAASVAVADRIDPQPAKSDQFELGYRLRGPVLDASIAAFYTTSRLMSTVDCSAPLEPCRPLREPRDLWGAEATLGWRIDSRWSLGGTLGWMEGLRTLETGERRRIGSNEVPPLLLGVHASYAPSAAWRTRVQVDYRGSRDPFGTGTAWPEGSVDSLVLVHLSTRVAAGPGHVQLGIRNLFDKRHYSIASESYNGGYNWIPEQGRRVFLSYDFKW